MKTTNPIKVSESVKNTVANVISWLFILLFTYAAVNKIIDFQNFTQQLGQSPLLSAFAVPLAFTVPAIELIIVMFIVIPKFRYNALIASFVLMLMFTVYIYIILNHSVFVPCSCGGILEKLTWTEHLIFNIVFVLLAVLAIGLQIEGSKGNVRKQIGIIAGLSMLGSAILIILFFLSENNNRYHNKFVRRLSNAPVSKIQAINLPFNSYYFAGADDTTIYLGNTTAQLLITEVNIKSGNIQEHHIALSNIDFPFRSITVKVRPPYFYVFDGMVPCAYRGKIDDWKAHLYNSGTEYFSVAEPIDSSTLFIRSQKRITGESILGKVDLLTHAATVLNKDILQKQIDGVFDTDGMLMFSNGINRILYLYAYRNQYIVVDNNMHIDFKGNTIDTISKANLEVVPIENRYANKLARQPLLVNKTAAVYNNLLFVNSNLPGKYESLDMWKKASIIDVYDIFTNGYLESFYIYDINEKKIRSLLVREDKLYVLVGNHLIIYKINPIIIKHYKTSNAGERRNNLLAK